MLPIKVPPLGESISEATVSRWLKQEGDAVAAGETLVELETDKITVEVPALKAGVLARRTRVDGDVVGVDDTLGELDETAVGVPSPAVVASAPYAAPRPAIAPYIVQSSMAAAKPVVPPPYVAPAAPAAPVAPTARTAPVVPVAPGAPVRSGPAARRLAAELGVEIDDVAGTGRGGVVSKPDVVAATPGSAARQPAAVPAPTARQPPATASAPQARSPSADLRSRETHEKMTTRRKRIAENLLQSQHATAHLTTFNEIDMSAMLALRDRLKERVEKAYDVKLSYMPFFAKATVMALKSFPVVNAQIVGDSIVYKHYVNLGIAVASEAGLVVPVLKGADALGIIGLSREIVAVAKRARQGRLTMDDLSGGSFTITNGGVFGSLLSTPIINYPQSGILGLHKMQDRPVAVDGKVEIRPTMYIALSYDHRIIDGQQAVLFLVRLKELMEDPASMLIE